ncbi:MAG: hypothetical protein ABIA21_03360, partial [Candidatus Aenigmatarchaeota archaeon]
MKKKQHRRFDEKPYSDKQTFYSIFSKKTMFLCGILLLAVVISVMIFLIPSEQLAAPYGKFFLPEQTESENLMMKLNVYSSQLFEGIDLRANIITNKPLPPTTESENYLMYQGVTRDITPLSSPQNCGDGICDASENCSTCEADCGVCSGEGSGVINLTGCTNITTRGDYVLSSDILTMGGNCI